ncbi:MAG: hypothetical protein K5798_09940 [Nitrosopumilus sp.]|uniref:hypothetical protein n=1 Tax=Nitrosopumilus sp. TaxID=2024843 RepID=UPI00242C6FAE|nr:hypothetical protein [Nitrosopumilus sp.]MCV0367565.1 hypothetical protein [Nitrosopumilus sp.]
MDFYRKMKTEHGVILTTGILVFVSLWFIASNPDSTPYETALVQINEKGIDAENAYDDIKLYEQAMQIQEEITKIASDSLGVHIVMSDTYQSYFPIAKGSDVKIQGEDSFQICNVVENIPSHLQEISKTKKFKLFAAKYSSYPIELNLQDERRNESLFHYGLIAKSSDGRTALTMFHVNSCTNQVTDSERYFLSCHDGATHRVFGTINKDDILASLNHPDFCTIPLDSWRQSVYDYNQKIHDQQDKHFQTVETVEQSHESLSAWDLENRRLGLLKDISSMYVMAIDNERDIEEKIRQYNAMFGSLPEEFLQLLEARK